MCDAENVNDRMACLLSRFGNRYDRTSALDRHRCRHSPNVPSVWQTASGLQGSARGLNMATILVTDDDTVCRETILKTLEREGHTLEAACDVDSAIEAVKRTHFDLIVCDYRMPEKTGLDL